MNTIEVKNNEIIKNITTDIEVKHTGTNVINLKIVFNRSTDLKIIYSGYIYDFFVYDILSTFIPIIQEINKYITTLLL